MRFDLVISTRGLANEVILLEDEKPQEYFFEWANKPSIIGNIYKGIVQKIIPGINAAFIDIGLEKNGFLFVKDVLEEWLEYAEIFGLGEKTKKKEKAKDISYLLQPGQTIFVKVKRGEVFEKGPRLTTFVSLPGNFVVLVPFLKFIGISKKITEKNEKQRLREIALKSFEITNKGIIIRTSAKDKKEDEILNEAIKLNKFWEDSKATEKIAPALIYKEPPLPFRILREFLSYPFKTIWVDEKETHEKVEDYLKNYNPDLLKSLKLYEKSRNIKEELNIKKDIDGLLNNKIWLKKGAHIIINQTEALCSIDVNSGKFLGKESIEETALKTNLEALKEIVRQIRLRNIGGLIVIDFIDMGSKKSRAEVVENFKREMSRDRSSYKFLKISEFGLLQMTRKRLYESPLNQIQVNCPKCLGTGKVKTGYKICQEIFEKVLEKYNPFKKIKVKVYCNSEIKKILKEEEWKKAFEKINVELKLKEEKNLKFDEYKIS